MKNIIFCDIDGTILDGSRNMYEVSDKTKYAINELAKDNYVFIASGRNKGLLEKQIIDLNPSGFILCNGAYAEFQNKKIYGYYFESEIVKKIVDVALKNNGFYVLETLNNMYVNDLKAEVFIKFLNGWGKALQNFKESSDLSNKYHIAMCGFDSEEDIAKFEEEVGSYVNVFRHNGFKSFDVNIPGIDKGIGVRKVMEYLNVDVDHTYCFGDGINDLEMLQTVGHPVVVANCDERLKSYNFETTYDVIEDGFYYYLLKHKLIKPL